MVRVRETTCKVTCSVCARAFTIPFKQYRAEVDFHKPTKAEPFQGTKFRWVCGPECQEVARATWGCPEFYRRKAASSANLAKARAAKAQRPVSDAGDSNGEKSN